jgi:hypothetical protein
LNYVACLNSANYQGHVDWRLPNINELRSLVNSGYNEQACGGVPCASLNNWLNTQGFSNMQLDYWSSTSSASAPLADAWAVLMTDGFIHIPSGKNAGGVFVLPVRGPSITGAVQIPRTGQTTSYGSNDDGALQTGVAWPSPRFNDNGNGTVTDNLTGLVWLKNALCTDTVGGILNPGTLVWSDALAWSNALASGACGLSDGSHGGDWRLPNREELESLIDFGAYNPALLAGYPFDSVQGAYWTSTTFGGIMPFTFAWVAYVTDGSLSVDGKSDFVSVWPVRGLSGPTGDLTILKSGAGAGRVKSSPAGIDCVDAVPLCATAFFPLGTVVSLSAIPPIGGPPFSPPYSLFSGWSGDPDCNDGRVTMIANVSCTANFDSCASQPVLIGATGYDSFTSAYADPLFAGGTIEAVAANLQEAPNFTLGKSVTLQGGFTCDFGLAVTYTIVTGSLTVTTGDVTISNVVIM